MGRLEGQVAVVTGGGRGIGRAIAEELLREGASVVISQRTDDELEATALALSRLGPAAAFVCDVANRDQVHELCDHAIATFGRLDIMVANAGTSSYSPFLEMTEDDWDRVLGTNLKGACMCSQAAAQRMVAAGNGGRLILISSICATAAEPNSAPYTASKGGISALVKAIAVDLARHRITANAIAPGWIHSSTTTAIAPAELVSGATRFPLNPLGEIGRAQEIGRAAVWLADPEASFATGTVITIDGGQTAELRTVNKRALGEL